MPQIKFADSALKTLSTIKTNWFTGPDVNPAETAGGNKPFTPEPNPPTPTVNGMNQLSKKTALGSLAENSRAITP